MRWFSVDVRAQAGRGKVTWRGDPAKGVGVPAGCEGVEGGPIEEEMPVEKGGWLSSRS